MIKLTKKQQIQKLFIKRMIAKTGTEKQIQLTLFEWFGLNKPKSIVGLPYKD